MDASSNPSPFSPCADWGSLSASPELCRIKSITVLPPRARYWVGNSSRLSSSSLPFVLDKSLIVYGSISIQGTFADFVF